MNTRKGEKMKKRIMKAVLAAAFVLVAGVVFAHPPSDIIITYDAKTKTLTADIIHDSKDIKNHYIEEAWVFLNGNIAIDQKATTQTDGKHQLFKYIMPDVKTGDTIGVGAECSVFGKNKKEITVTEVKGKKGK
jgi:hypothetical protein